MAYSGEKAAGYAYAGHWRSIKAGPERTRIQEIERDEWKHRAIVGEILSVLDAKPQFFRELLMAMIGRTVGCACFLIGRFLPMYFAGKLESANIKEYEHASQHAQILGLQKYAAELMKLSEVEKEHELFFFDAVREHRMLPVLRRIFNWGPESKSSAIEKKASNSPKRGNR